MKRKKILALLMVAALCVGTVAGCGSKDTESSKSESGKNENSESSTGDSKDDLSPITFKYYNADGKNGNWENPVAQAITEATGVTLDISYPVSSTGDPDEDISLMIAEDEYPDMIYAKQSVNSLYEAGALIDMTDLIEEYGPNIKKMYGDEFEKLKWGSGDEGIYQLSYAGVGYQILATGGNCQIQYAALKENNYEYPKTLEEYEALIKQYLAAHPKTDDGLDTIGISMSAADWHWLITLSNPAGFIADGAPDNGSWLVDDNYNCIYKHVSDKEKEYFRWLSRMYDEGILDPNFATQTDDDYIAKLASGRVVAITDALWHYGQAEATLKAEGKLDKTYCPLPVTIDAETKAPTLMYQGLQVGYGMAITKSCEDPVRAIKFLDYLCSDEGAVLYKWGVEGENYNPYTPVTRESVIAEYNEEQKAACEAWNVEMLTDIFPQPDEFETPPYSPLWAYATPQEITNNVEILNEIAWPGLIKCVTESVDNFDANWDKLIADYEANGLEETEQMMTDFLAEKIS